MSKLEIIRECLSGKFKVVDKTALKEKDKDTRGKEFEYSYKIVKQNGIDFELFRFEAFAFPYFEDVSGLKKNSDYVVFAEQGIYLHVLIFELKKGQEGASKQLNAAKVFVEYIIESLRRIGKSIDEKVAIRTIRVSQYKIEKFKKRPVKEKDAISYDVNNFCDYPYENIYLERLMQY